MKERKVNNTMDYILERLAVGDIEDARIPPRGITALLNCAEEHDTSREGYAYCKIPLIDFQPIDPQCIPKAVNWIKEMISDHTILVHCNAGIGRSPSIAVCYLHEIGFGFEEAVRLVRSKRPDALPHRDLRSAIMLAKRMSSFK
jgi:histidinol-phosphate aminotransferase